MTGNSKSMPAGNFDQPVLAIVDPQTYTLLHSAIESAFASGQVGAFLKMVAKAGLRVREFEAVLAKGLLGDKTQAAYGALGNADQGQTREFYLARLERVPAELRANFSSCTRIIEVAMAFVLA